MKTRIVRVSLGKQPFTVLGSQGNSSGQQGNQIAPLFAQGTAPTSGLARYATARFLGSNVPQSLEGWLEWQGALDIGDPAQAKAEPVLEFKRYN